MIPPREPRWAGVWGSAAAAVPRSRNVRPLRPPAGKSPPRPPRFPPPPVRSPRPDGDRPATATTSAHTREPPRGRWPSPGLLPALTTGAPQSPTAPSPRASCNPPSHHFIKEQAHPVLTSFLPTDDADPRPPRAGARPAPTRAWLCRAAPARRPPRPRRAFWGPPRGPGSFGMPSPFPRGRRLAARPLPRPVGGCFPPPPPPAGQQTPPFPPRDSESREAAAGCWRADAEGLPPPVPRLPAVFPAVSAAPRDPLPPPGRQMVIAGPRTGRPP